MPTKKKNINEKYKKYEHREHVLELPDTYIGSINKVEDECWIINKNNELEQKSIKYTPGLLKIFDEILVNARDHHVRLISENNNELVTQIKVSIDKENNTISIYNNGAGIDVEIHEEHNVYVPELIFGHLLTSANYDKNEEKITGGKNGYGSKLTNIFSTEFTIETVDSTRNRKFVQVYTDNMSIVGKPKITTCRTKPYTKITFKPDLNRFQMKSLEKDTISLMKKRVYDMAAITDKSVSVYLNDERIEFKTFEKYVDKYINEDKKTRPRVYEKINDRWEISACLSTDGKFEQVSFVNGICTTKGGKHVDYISNQLSKRLTEHISKKKKKINIKQNYIKDNLWVFVNSTITNPTFTSQTKEYMSTNIKDFGSKCDINDKFIDKLSKCGIIERATLLTEFKENNSLKKTDGKKKSVLRGIPKLEDANYAGTAKSNNCTLILTEGDSAKTFAVSGLSIVGRNNYGVFPLKGKLLNVREATAKQLLENEEINNIKKIMGLQQGKEYENTDFLRYGSILILTDADVDGSHIKGLIINLLHHFWPQLLKIKNFVKSMATPVVKVSKGNTIIPFYTLSEYNDWKNDNNASSWHIKYYKGLGTSTSNEAKEYFKELNNNVLSYKWNLDNNCNSAIKLAFEKKQSDNRKDWLANYNKNSIINNNNKNVSYDEFVNKELIHFSNYDNERSIPSICDGLKPSQRKILYSAFLKNLIKEIKVAQFAGYISEKSSYHHGEASLMSAIISMAQNFVGSNNLNLLKPNGQFGTRLEGGKDSSSPRYIFTELNNLTSIIFDKNDFPLLNQLNDDGFLIEPEWYMPIIPMVLINGCEGIGTGFSTNIPSYNPLELVVNLIHLMDNKKLLELKPWYNNFKGSIIKNGNNFITKGVYNKINDTTIEITELPVGSWTGKYKEFLESNIIDSDTKEKEKKKKGFILDWKYGENYTESTVHFIVKFNKPDLKKLLSNLDDFEKKMKLTSTLNTTNMHLHNIDGNIKKYNDINEILKEYYNIRLIYYDRRRSYLLEKFKKDTSILNSKIKFIEGIINKSINIFNKTKNEINHILANYNPPFPYDNGNYDYLTNMRIYTFSKEKINDLKHQYEKLMEEYTILQSKTPIDIWKNDLSNFVKTYKKTDNNDVIKSKIKGKGKAKSITI